MTNISDKPYYLSSDDIEWVEKTLSSLSVEEKVGQLFNLAFASDDAELEKMLKLIHPGGMTFRVNHSSVIKRQTGFLRKISKVPMLISANLESGGCGVAIDGTDYASQIEVAATGNTDYAYILGDICGKEGSAVGCNYSFAPVVDILYNWRNPIVNTRSYSSEPDKVIAFAREYIRAIRKYHFAVTLKHFPGDGVDERDQHLVSSVNTMSAEEWDDSFGKVYKTLIDEGAQSIMVGHILLPAYSKALNPSLRDEDILPSSLSYEIVTGLLKNKLGFNGVVITDSASMVGLGCAMKRRDIPSSCINAGCDIFLFGRNWQEDYDNLLRDVREGVVSRERLDDAVTKILALKASLGLHKEQEEYSLDAVGCEEHKNLARECADKAITLVKNKDNILPINPKQYKNLLLVVLGDNPSFRGGSKIGMYLEEKLKEAGFCVTMFDSDISVDLIDEKVSALQKKYDLILYAANEAYGANDTVNRLKWIPLSSGHGPQLVNDIPTIFASFLSPFCLADVPMVHTYINCYNDSKEVVDSFVDKLIGRSFFCGTSPVDPFCGLWGTDL